MNSAPANEVNGNDYRYIFKQYLRKVLSDMSMLDATLNPSKDDDIDEEE